MVGVLASSVVDRGFEPRSGQTKDYKIGICCFSAKHAATCLSADCSFSELSLYKKKQKNKRIGLVQTGSHRHLSEI